MRSKVLSVVVIVAVLLYIYFGLIVQQPGLGMPEGTYGAFHVTTLMMGLMFSLLGVMATGYFLIRWIIK